MRVITNDTTQGNNFTWRQSNMKCSHLQRGRTAYFSWGKKKIGFSAVMTASECCVPHIFDSYSMRSDFLLGNGIWRIYTSFCYLRQTVKRTPFTGWNQTGENRFCLFLGKGKHCTHFEQRVKGILSNTFWEESQLERGEKKHWTAASVEAVGKHYGIEAAGKQRTDGQKPFSVKLKTRLPACSGNRDCSAKSRDVFVAGQGWSLFKKWMALYRWLVSVFTSVWRWWILTILG